MSAGTALLLAEKYAFEYRQTVGGMLSFMAGKGYTSTLNGRANVFVQPAFVTIFRVAVSVPDDEK